MKRIRRFFEDAPRGRPHFNERNSKLGIPAITERRPPYWVEVVVALLMTLMGGIATGVLVEDWHDQIEPHSATPEDLAACHAIRQAEVQESGAQR